MGNKQIFKKYYSKLILEGIIKATIFAAIAGFATSFVLAFVAFWANFNPVWWAVTTFFAVTVIATPIVYFIFFRPTTKQIAKRIDNLGLDERLITMMELEKDESYIALRQREDAKSKLRTVKREWIKLSILILPVVILAVLAVLSTLMVTVSALSVDGKLSWGPNAPPTDEDYVNLVYLADPGGYIEGDELQIILIGSDSLTVIAVAEDGYAFDGWSDGISVSVRTDRRVEDDITVYATFARLGDPEEPDEHDEPKPGSGNQEDDGRPKELVEAPGESGNTNMPGNGPGESGGEGGGKYIEVNQIIDGETYYRTDYDIYYNDVLKDFEDGVIPAYLREIIEGYFKAIK